MSGCHVEVGAGAGQRPQLVAWHPPVDGIVEVFRARFIDHSYPPHTHDAWTLLIIDDGGIRYDLDRHHHGAAADTVTLLPPHVPHDGRAASGHGFRKRVLYLDSAVLDHTLVGAAVDGPGLADAWLRRHIHRLHNALDHPGDAFEAESRLALVTDRLAAHLRRRDVDHRSDTRRKALAHQLRDLLDADVIAGISMREAATTLHANPAHLVRSFTAEFGLPPHRYLTGRRIDLARRLLLGGQRPSDVAVAAGFYDQSHLNRHFRRFLGTTPSRYATIPPPPNDHVW